MQQDTRTDIIITVVPKAILTGEVMITGTIWTEHTWAKFITTKASTMNGEGIVDITGIIIDF